MPGELLGLCELTEYVEELSKVVERPYLRSSQYSFLFLDEGRLKDLPSITLNLPEDVWLQAERVVPSPPPEPDANVKPWITITSDPSKPPSIKDHVVITITAVEAAKWVTLGRAKLDDFRPRPPKAGGVSEVDVLLRLSAFPEFGSRVQGYVDGPWSAWAATEKTRRAAKAIYEKLFSLQKSIESAALSKPLEILWGVGMLHWQHPQVGLLHHALIEIPVEILIDPETASISIKPAGRRPRIAENLISAIAIGNAANFLTKATSFFADEQRDIVSPFAPDTFTPLLKFAATDIDPEGEFLAEQCYGFVGNKEAVDGHLVINGGWAIYARPRTDNFIIEDLRKQREKLGVHHSNAKPLPGVLKRLVGSATESETKSPPGSPLPGGRTQRVQAEPEFYLPKAYNDNQIEIVRKLDSLNQDGAVVQGPPGTGKTHTIANIICHFLATGRRVLVASHSEAALNVLPEQIPEGVRDLTVSILTSEREGHEQLEKAVRHIQQATSLNSPAKLAMEIERHSTAAIQCRQKLSAIESRLRQIAQQQLAELGGQRKRAWEWAELVVEGASKHSWLPDHVTGKQKPSFTVEHIDKLRKARKALGLDLNLVKANLPALRDLPNASAIATIHNDMLTLERLSKELSRLPALSIHQQAGEERAEECKQALETVISALRIVREAPWLEQILAGREGFDSLHALFEKISTLAKERLAILNTAVGVPAEVFSSGLEAEIKTALDRVIAKKSPFPPLKGKRIKKLFSEIVIGGQKLDLNSSEQAIQVKTYLTWRKEVDSFVVTWNTVAEELDLPSLENSGIGRWLSDTAVWIEKIRAAKRQAIPALVRELPYLFPGGVSVAEVLSEEDQAEKILNVISASLALVRLRAASETVAALKQALKAHSGAVADDMADFVSEELGAPNKTSDQITQRWNALLGELKRQLEKGEDVNAVRSTAELIRSSGAPLWAEKILAEPATQEEDVWSPSYWQESWRFRQVESYLNSINKHSELKQLSQQRQQTLDELERAISEEVRLRTTMQLLNRLDDHSRGDLAMVVALLSNMGTGAGKQAAFLRRDVQNAMERCYSAVPCWIMPSWRVSEMLPSEPGSFDLVVIDEASQSDIRELPVVLRGQKILVVGDDKQVSPSPVGIPVNKIELLSSRYLANQPFGPLMRPGFSLYDLFLAVFGGQKTILREHFRCVEPIIRFSLQFYTEKIEPLRIPRASERLDPPLIDVHLTYGHKERNKTNPAEANYIVDEIEKITKDGSAENKTIGVVSLLGFHQAALIEKLLLKRVGEEAILRHNILVGDASTFQGKERNIVFVSMVSAPNDFRKVTAKPFQQRFNVAFSRARDRVYLVRSLSLDDLNPDDLKAKAIMHLQDPMKGSAAKHEKDRALCESGFEREVYDSLVAEGYAVTPQVPVGDFRIDMVIEGGGDRRLAVELDGEKWHGPERWWADYRRQLALERMGWTFWRCWGSDWKLNRSACLQDLRSMLVSLGIRPGSSTVSWGEYTEHRIFENAPSYDTEEEQVSNGLVVEPGDSVEVEFSEQEPPKRATYVISLNSYQTGNEVVRIDSPVGRMLLGAAVGDDLIFPDTNGNIIVTGIFKGIDQSQPSSPTGFSASPEGLSLH